MVMLGMASSSSRIADNIGIPAYGLMALKGDNIKVCDRFSFQQFVVICFPAADNPTAESRH